MTESNYTPDSFAKRKVDKDACTGKLPEGFVDKVISDHEDFKKRWLEACENFDIQVPLVELGQDEPFLGSLSRRTRKVAASWLPTAGVSPYKGNMQLFFNPIFMYELMKGIQEEGDTIDYAKGKKLLRGVIKHEFFHILFEHVTVRREMPAPLWNVATDCAINSLIPREELPDFCLFPGELYTPKNPKPDWKPSLISEKIKDFPPQKASEWYMHKLLEDEDIKKAIEEAQQESGQSGHGDGEESGSSGGNSQKDFNKALNEKLYGGNGGQMDDHEIWDELSDSERDKLRDSMRDIMRDCVREAEGTSSGWGSVPSSVQSHLKKMFSNEVDWRDLLSNFIGRSRASTTTSTYKRISRRCPYDFPGRKRAYTCNVAAAIDQSGSMSDTWVSQLFAELDNLGNLSSFDVIPFDTQVAVDEIQHVRKGQKANPVRVQQGGTDFNAPVRYVNDNKEMYDVLLILTDGGCYEPAKCDIPVAYILAPGCDLYFKTNELVIKMTNEK